MFHVYYLEGPETNDLCRNAPAATLVNTIEAAMGSPKPKIAGTHGVMQSTMADPIIPRGVAGAVVTNIT